MNNYDKTKDVSEIVIQGKDVKDLVKSIPDRLEEFIALILEPDEKFPIKKIYGKHKTLDFIDDNLNYVCNLYKYNEDEKICASIDIYLPKEQSNGIVEKDRLETLKGNRIKAYVLFDSIYEDQDFLGFGLQGINLDDTDFDQISEDFGISKDDLKRLFDSIVVEN